MRTTFLKMNCNISRQWTVIKPPCLSSIIEWRSNVWSITAKLGCQCSLATRLMRQVLSRWPSPFQKEDHLLLLRTKVYNSRMKLIIWMKMKLYPNKIHIKHNFQNLSLLKTCKVLTLKREIHFKHQEIKILIWLQLMIMNMKIQIFLDQYLQIIIHLIKC